MFYFWDVIENEKKEIRILGYRNRDSTVLGSGLGSYYDLTLDKKGNKIKEISTAHDIDKNLLAAPGANLSFYKNVIVENTQFLKNDIMYYTTRTLDDTFKAIDTLFEYKKNLDVIDYYFAKNQYNQFLNLIKKKDNGPNGDYKIVFLDEELKIKDSMNYTGTWLGGAFVYTKDKFIGITRTEDNYKKSPNLLLKKDFITKKETIIEFGDSIKYKMAGMLPDGNILLYGKKYNIMDNCVIILLTVINDNADIINDFYLSECDSNYLAFATIFDNDKVALTWNYVDIPFWKILKYKASSIESTNELKSELYPNPVNEELQIEFDDFGLDNWNIQVTDLLGNIVIKQILPINKKIDVSKLVSGSYNIKIYNGDKQVINRFVKN